MPTLFWRSSVKIGSRENKISQKFTYSPNKVTSSLIYEINWIQQKIWILNFLPLQFYCQTYQRKDNRAK